jgi:hypothetical protein
MCRRPSYNPPQRAIQIHKNDRTCDHLQPSSPARTKVSEKPERKTYRSLRPKHLVHLPLPFTQEGKQSTIQAAPRGGARVRLLPPVHLLRSLGTQTSDPFLLLDKHSSHPPSPNKSQVRSAVAACPATSQQQKPQKSDQYTTTMTYSIPSDVSQMKMKQDGEATESG